MTIRYQAIAVNLNVLLDEVKHLIVISTIYIETHAMLNKASFSRRYRAIKARNIQ